MEMSTVNIPKGEYFSVEDAAMELQITVGRIRQMIRWGELPAIKISARAWIISAKEVESAKSNRRGAKSGKNKS